MNERKLLQRARALDESALGTIFDTYYDPLYRYIYHHTGHQRTAEDLTADVFSRFVEQLGEGKGPKEYLKAWLYRVAHNLVVDYHRRQTHRDHEQLDYHMQANEQAVVSQAHESFLIDHAREALQHLTDKQRMVVTLKYLEGLETGEIARILNTTDGAIRALQHRGLKALRRYLIDTGVVTEDDV